MAWHLVLSISQLVVNIRLKIQMVERRFMAADQFHSCENAANTISYPKQLIIFVK